MAVASPSAGRRISRFTTDASKAGGGGAGQDDPVQAQKDLRDQIAANTEALAELNRQLTRGVQANITIP